MKIRLKSFFVFFLGLSSYAVFGHDIPVHQAITYNAQELAHANSSGYTNFLNTISNDVAFEVATNSMVHGSGYEDNKDVQADGSKDIGGKRSLNHFYDPLDQVYGKALSDFPTDGRKLEGRDSFDWASISNCPGYDIFTWDPTGWLKNRNTVNIWSWQNARGYEWLGLTASSLSERTTNLLNMFRAVGQVMHLLEDTSQPQHVRNEQHLDVLGKAFWESPIEDWGLTNANNLNYGDGSMLDWRSSGFTKLVDFWDRGFYTAHGVQALDDDAAATDPTKTLGLAEWSNGNFLGDRHLFPEYFKSGDIEYYPFPSRNHSTDYNDVRLHPGQHIQPQSLKNGQQGYGIYLNKTGDGIAYDYIARVNYLGVKLPNAGLKGASFCTIRDDNVLSSYHDILIPKAVEYAAGLLDYFFRGTISVTMIGYNTNTQTYTNLVTNTTASGQNFSAGTFSIYQDGSGGSRSLVTNVNLSGTLSAGQNFTITFSGSIAPTNNLLLVYQGSIGTTDPVDANIGIAAKSFHPLFEETTTTNYVVSLSEAGVSPGGTISGTLESDEVPFTITSGHYKVHIDIAYFDDKGTIGGIASTGPSTSCYGDWGNEISNVDVPDGDVTISPDGKHLQVNISATDDARCGGNIGWGQPYGPEPVTIDWQAWPTQ